MLKKRDSVAFSWEEKKVNVWPRGGVCDWAQVPLGQLHPGATLFDMAARSAGHPSLMHSALEQKTACWTFGVWEGRKGVWPFSEAFFWLGKAMQKDLQLVYNDHYLRTMQMGCKNYCFWDIVKAMRFFLKILVGVCLEEALLSDAALPLLPNLRSSQGTSTHHHRKT